MLLYGGIYLPPAWATYVWVLRAVYVSSSDVHPSDHSASCQRFRRNCAWTCVSNRLSLFRRIGPMPEMSAILEDHPYDRRSVHNSCPILVYLQAEGLHRSTKSTNNQSPAAMTLRRSIGFHLSPTSR
jgi:hypothetical protein